VSEPLVLAIDQGTTNTKAIVVGTDGGVRAWSSVRVGTEFPQPGWVQSDAAEIWDSVRRVTADGLSRVSVGSAQSIGISNQRESVVAWERTTGSPLGPVISWQCGRTASLCAALREVGHGELVSERTGLVLDPMFAASKMAWLLDAIDDGADLEPH
jgi:glycerol kinase